MMTIREFLTVPQPGPHCPACESGRMKLKYWPAFAETLPWEVQESAMAPTPSRIDVQCRSCGYPMGCYAPMNLEEQA